MAEESHPVLVFIQKPVEFAEIVAHLLDRYSRIFPAWPGVFHARNPACAHAVFAYFPNQFLIVFVFDQPDPVVIMIDGADFPHGLLREFVRPFLRIGAELEQDIGIRTGKKILAGHMVSLTMLVIDYLVMKTLKTDRTQVAKGSGAVSRRKYVGETENQQCPMYRAVYQLHLRAQRDGTGTLGSDQRASH